MSEEQSYKSKIVFYLLITLSAVGYYSICYNTKRESFYEVFGWFSLLFSAYYLLIRFFSITHFYYLLGAGLLFRVLILFSVPNLSDDVYRFIWDGRLAANGINPFSFLPAEVMQMTAVTGITKGLFVQLNSPEHYTIYPPVMQGIFWLAAKVFPVNVHAAITLLKCMILVFEIGTLFLLGYILKKLSLPKYLALLYFLNPLIITELTGNVHFEGVMIFFLLFAILLLLKNNWKLSAICLAFGIATKLIPVIFIPLVINKLGWKKGMGYSLISLITSLILFALVFDIATIQHMLKSVDLFIRKFEFNASVYYVVRYFGTLVKGYNIIAIAGPVLILVSATIIIFISFMKNNISEKFFNKALLIISTWFLFSTTVHPWYICLPVALSVFTTYRFAIIWSFTATLSYYAYQTNPVQENLWLLAAGYIFMTGYALWELKKMPSQHLI